MKICWDNLENIIYLKNGIFRNEKSKYFVLKTCKICNKEYLGDKYANSKYCSAICRWKSPEVIHKISESNKGRIFSDIHKEKLSIARQGKKLTKTAIDKIKKWNKENKEIHQKKTIEGLKKYREKHPEYEEKRNRAAALGCKMGKNWKGGITNQPYCCDWRFIRVEYKEYDGNKCQNPQCNGKSKRMTSHHIDYNKQNCHPNNVITLCVSCNSLANKNRDWWESFYKKIKRRKNARNTIKCPGGR